MATHKGNEPDEYLMGQVALGNQEYLEPLVRRYASSLLTFLMRMNGDRHRSEELFQDVFLAVWLKRKQYKFPKPFRSWLFAIAANHCRSDFRRKRPRRLTAEEMEDLHGGELAGSPAEQAVAVETAACVTEAVAALPVQQRTVLVLRVWHELSYAEIAQIVGRGEGTVRSNMHHALAGLRRVLEPRLRGGA